MRGMQPQLHKRRNKTISTLFTVIVILRKLSVFFSMSNQMQALTDNMYMNAIEKHRNVIARCCCHINQHKHILLLDFDKYSKQAELKDSLYYIYIDSLPWYCSTRLTQIQMEEIPVCIKHTGLFFLTSVYPHQ